MGYNIGATGWQFVALVIVSVIGAIAIGGVITLALLDHEAHQKARAARRRADRRSA